MSTGATLHGLSKGGLAARVARDIPRGAFVIRRDKDIYATDGGWYRARWHFSFGHYHHPAQMGVGALRVFNDDRLQPGAVWPLHPHQDIESCTYVVEGLFAHEDSLGNDGQLEPGG